MEATSTETEVKTKVIPLTSIYGAEVLARIEVTQENGKFKGEFELDPATGQFFFDAWEILGLSVYCLPAIPKSLALNFKRYEYKPDGLRHGNTVQAIQITSENLMDLVSYIVNHGGAATGHNGDTASGRPARIRIKQRNYGENWGKVDWRVARVGDYIIRHDFPNGEHHREPGTIEFARVHKYRFEETFETI